MGVLAIHFDVRPIAHARHEAVLERIDMAILDMAGVISLIADKMFPEPALPDATFAARNSRTGSRLATPVQTGS